MTNTFSHRTVHQRQTQREHGRKGINLVITKQIIRNIFCHSNHNKKNKKRPASLGDRTRILFIREGGLLHGGVGHFLAVGEVGHGGGDEHGRQGADYHTEEHGEHERADRVTTEDEDTCQHQEGRQ